MNKQYYQKLLGERDADIIKLRASLEILEEEIKYLKLENKRLNDIISKNSSNSSKAPSSDVIKKTTSLREKSPRKIGGQLGHKGNTLKQSYTPEINISHSPNKCSCGCDLINVKTTKTEKRQVIDVPQVHYTVTEHSVEHKICPKCGKDVAGLFPDDVKAPVSYGSNVKSIASYLMNHQMVPFKRTQEILMDLYSLPISEGTLNNIKNALSGCLDSFISHTKNELIKSSVLNVDETGININGQRHWLHVASNKFMTLIFPHPKRGREAMDALGILPLFKGVASHDFWKAYLTYENCQHSFCNAHILRELKFFTEQHDYLWSRKMTALLVEAKNISEEKKASGGYYLSDSVLDTLDNLYELTVKDGFIEVTSRGSIKENKGAYNLLKRLRDYNSNILHFAYDLNTPFDNNQAERDIRMEKVRQKISGTIRSKDNALSMSRIRSYIKTVQKNNINVLEAIKNAFANNSFSPLRC